MSLFLATALVFPNTLKAAYAARGKGAWLYSPDLDGPIEETNLDPKKLEGKPEATLKDGPVLFNMQYNPENRDPKVMKLFAYLEHLHLKEGYPRPKVELPNSVMGIRVLDQDDPVLAVIHDSSEKSPKQEAWDKGPILGLSREVQAAVFKTFTGQEIDVFKQSVGVIAANDNIYRGLTTDPELDEALQARAMELTNMAWAKLHEEFSA